MLADRAADKLLAAPDRLFERIAPSQPGGDGRGIGAAGPVGGNAGDKRAGELRHSLAVEEQIDRALAIEMTALEQETGPKFSRQVRARNSHFFQIADWLSGEHSGLRHVRSDERGAG